MTDNDVIKALECCLAELCHCKECPRFVRGVDDCHVDTDSNGNVLKNEDCLLAERKERLK